MKSLALNVWPGFGGQQPIINLSPNRLCLNLLFAALPQYAMRGNQLLLSILVGANMLHYYLDSIIWRTRSDKELAAALRLAG